VAKTPDSFLDNVTASGIWWQKTVEREHKQADRLREANPLGDFWKPVAHRFAPPKKGESGPDDTVDRLVEITSPYDTVLDVGAGGGRLAIPIADHVSHVTAVEPSDSMRERLTTAANAWGQTNVSVIGDRWEDTVVDPHDLVICAHVVYTVREIESFIRKLTDHSRKTVALISFERPATAMYLPLWEPIHGEERVELPALLQIRELLNALEIDFSETLLREWIPRPFRTLEEAQQECETRLSVAPGTKKSERLARVLENSLTEVEGGYRLKWALPHLPRIISWQP